MRAQDNEQQVLNAIETQLRNEDPCLAACLMAFTSVARNTGMPTHEQLTEGPEPAPRRRHRHRTRPSYTWLIQLVTLFIAGMILCFVVPEFRRRRLYRFPY